MSNFYRTILTGSGGSCAGHLLNALLWSAAAFNFASKGMGGLAVLGGILAGYQICLGLAEK